ncbi:MAG TPA: cytochrome c oxidase subunit 3 [Steroidobacteraceae bacterium]|nr:cytochrome c oxidase subunit 3 [Steroidobacteraceae bacterium]
MSNTAIVVALLVGVAAWFAVASRLTAKPWENREQKGDVGAIGISPARIGLWVFMAVVTSLFALFLSAYSMRMHHGVGWCHLTVPRIVWLNTVVLLGASVAMQLASSAVAHGRRPFARTALVAAGVLSIGFLAGQVAAWQAIGPTLYYVQGSPAIAFFYVLTIVHGLHLLGGLYVLGRAAHRFAGGAELVDLRQSLSLCATYWHFLLLVWLAVFGVLLYL